MAIVKPNGFYTGARQGNQIIGKGSPDNVTGFYAMRYSSPTGCGNAPDVTKEFFYGAYGDWTSAITYANADSVFIKTGQWYNLVFTYDGFEAKFYINGALKKVYPSTITFTPNTQDLYIGRDGDATYPFFINGAIDEIRIYNKALTDRDVMQLNGLKQ